MENNPSQIETNPPPSVIQQTNVWAIVSLVSGVLAWLGLFGLGGIAAVICGHVAKGQIRASGGLQGGDGLATIGLVLGYINVAITVMAVCLGILIMVGAISGAAICPFIINNTGSY
jgi:hypothetical protein